MSKQMCSNKDCAAPVNCHELHDNYLECPYWNAAKAVTGKNVRHVAKKGLIPWTGSSFLIEELNFITRRNTPIFLGVFGKAYAAKTTFLAMLYTLLQNGHSLKEFEFAGSKTILAWDELYDKLRLQQSKVAFPDPTPTNYYRLLHLALRDKDGKLRDVFFADASGEVFSDWAVNKDHDNAENARWIYKNGNGFALFIDCEDLVLRKNAAKEEVLEMAHMLNLNLGKRPVVIVWSKADRINDIIPEIKTALTENLQTIFYDFKEIEISNFSKEDPDLHVHKNNLTLVDTLLSDILKMRADKIDIKIPAKDLFLNYGGNE